MFKTSLIILSDQRAAGTREDLCLPVFEKYIKEPDFKIIDKKIISDDMEGIKEALLDAVHNKKADLILTSGGTGFSKRDNTPEATAAVATRKVPGIAEAIRAYSMEYTNRAMLSRADSVICEESLIINLPGSPKALEEVLEFIISPVIHGLEILKDQDSECGR